MQFANVVRTLTLYSVLALLGSCGGGGNDFPETAPPPSPTQPNPNANPGTGTTTPTTTPPPVTNSGDTQAPQVSMILPADNASVSGNIQLLADADDNVGVFGVQFRVGDISLGGLIAQRPYTTDFDTTYLPDGTHAFSARAYDTSGNTADAPARNARVRNTCKTASPAVTQWQNTSFQGRSGIFNAQWDVTPVRAGSDALIGLARGAQNDWSGMSTAVRFNTNNTIDVINGDTYGAATTISYSPNVTYRIRMQVDVAARHYSAYVTELPGGTEQTLATNFAFRRVQDQLDYWVVEAEQGALRGCNFSVTPVAAPPPPPPGNTAPTANAGPDQSVTEGSAVALNGAGTDTDGTIVSYAWAQISGPAVALANANTQRATFTAPQVTAATQLGFRLTVQDNGGATGSDTAIVTVNDSAPAPNNPPSANAGPDQTAAERSTVALNGTARDTDGTIAAVQWSQLIPASPRVTINNPNTLNANFVAPEVTANTVFTFELRATDNVGASTSDSANVTVTNTSTTTTTGTTSTTRVEPLNPNHTA